MSTTKETCCHRRALLDSASRLIAAVERGRPDVRVLAKRWLAEDRCDGECTKCPRREGEAVKIDPRLDVAKKDRQP